MDTGEGAFCRQTGLPRSFVFLGLILVICLLGLLIRGNRVTIRIPEIGSSITLNKLGSRASGPADKSVDLELVSLLDPAGEKNVSSVVCRSELWIDMPLFYWGKMYLANESNLAENRLNKFLSPLQPIDTTQVDGEIGTRHVSFLQRRNHRIERFPMEGNVVVLPSWCASTPYPDIRCEWQRYTTAIWHDSMLCFWPFVPEQAHDADQSHLDVGMWSTRFDNSSMTAEQVMISGGFFGNFWHAAAILNSWCNVRNQKDVYFLVQAPEIPRYVFDIALELGIDGARIVHHKGPVVSRQVTFAPYRGNVDWSCLHGALSRPAVERMGIVLYLRPAANLNRNIPTGIHYKLAASLSSQFPDYDVKTFMGNETLEDARLLFQEARIVIGPHGAGMVNLIYCKEGTPVVELTVDGLLNRPWQAMGGQTFALKWWPVLLKSFDSEEEILSIGPLVEKALYLSQVNDDGV